MTPAERAACLAAAEAKVGPLDEDGNAPDASHGDDPAMNEKVAHAAMDAAYAMGAAKYKDRDVEVMRVALASLRSIRATLASRAEVLRVAGEDNMAAGIEEAIKTLDETVFA